GLEAIRLMFRAGLRPSVVRLYDPFDTAMVGDQKPHVATRSPAEAPALSRELLPAVLRVLAPQALGRPAWLNRASGLFRRSRLLAVLLVRGRRRRGRRALPLRGAVARGAVRGAERRSQRQPPPRRGPAQGARSARVAGRGALGAQAAQGAL